MFAIFVTPYVAHVDGVFYLMRKPVVVTVRKQKQLIGPYSCNCSKCLMGANSHE
jgi:hypothetical protein